MIKSDITFLSSLKDTTPSHSLSVLTQAALEQLTLSIIMKCVKIPVYIGG